MKQVFDYKHSLRQRFILTTILMLIPLALLVVFQYSVFNNTIKHLNNVIDHGSSELTGIKELQHTIHIAVMVPHDYLIHGKLIERENYTALSDKVSTTINNMLILMAPHKNEHDLVKQVDQLWAQVDQKSLKVLSSTNPVGNSAVAEEMELLDSLSDQAISVLQQLFDVAALEMAEEVEEAEQLCAIMIMLIIGGTSISALFILWLSRNLAKVIIKPICCLKDAANRVGKGDYSSCLSWTRHDEIGDLAHSFDDMTQYLEQAHNELKLLSRQDGLTEILNRREFDRMFPIELNRAVRYDHNLSLVFIDLDHFKEINDKYGHLTGDHVLQIFAKLVKSTIREIDQFARYGGEEFVLILYEADRDGAYVLAERIRKLIEGANFGEVDDEPVRVTVSIGIASLPKNGSTEKDLIESADKAVYQAKREGRNRVVCAD